MSKPKNRRETVYPGGAAFRVLSYARSALKEGTLRECKSFAREAIGTQPNRLTVVNRFGDCVFTIWALKINPDDDAVLLF